MILTSRLCMLAPILMALATKPAQSTDMELVMEDWVDAAGKPCSNNSTDKKCSPLKIKCKLPDDMPRPQEKVHVAPTGKPPASASTPSPAPAPASASSPAAGPTESKTPAPATPPKVPAAPDASPKTPASPAAPAASASTSTQAPSKPSTPSAAPAAAPPAAPAGGASATGPSPAASDSAAKKPDQAPAAGAASTNGTAAAAGGVNVTAEEFNKAVTSCGFPAPPAQQYTDFVAGIPKSGIDSKRELAAFLAQILHESQGLQFKEEVACKGGTCPGQYDSGPGGQYYGRGYIQLTWQANYQAASQALFGDDRLVQKPQSVAEDDAIAWAVSFWFWNTNVHNQPGVKEGKFGASTKAINGALECGSPNEKAKKRFEHYTKILTAFGISDAPDESGCYN